MNGEFVLWQLNIKLHIILHENLINYFFILMRMFMENIQNSDKYVGKNKDSYFWYSKLVSSLSITNNYGGTTYISFISKMILGTSHTHLYDKYDNIKWTKIVWLIFTFVYR
jgi:hypothetical protein